MKLKIVGATLMVLSLNTFAASVTTVTTITKLYTYGEDHGILNNIVIKVSNPVARCEAGFWVKSSDSSANKNIAAFLLSAFHANSKVYIGAYDDKKWSGSAGNYCKLHTIGLEK